jgi:hypothetical protein
MWQLVAWNKGTCERQLKLCCSLLSCCCVLRLCRSGAPGSCLLTPPDAVGDESAELTPAQLANQAVLAARKAIVRWGQASASIAGQHSSGMVCCLCCMACS